ncbi:hypothetical protein GCM10022244_30510 [Streptomyces gulbargensis]|uniref:Uncharacterized protein n=1 Tax=Streptomyces gulbargensis TaxID=364901 RepID=A0ABP7MF12_9ACTN
MGAVVTSGALGSLREGEFRTFEVVDCTPASVPGPEIETEVSVGGARRGQARTARARRSGVQARAVTSRVNAAMMTATRT